MKDGRIAEENFNTYDSMRIAQMPKVESIIMPSRRLVLGRHRRAHDLRRGAGGAERVLRRDRQAHPLGAAEEPRHRAGVKLFAVALLLLAGSAFGNDSIPASLTGAKGDPERGRAIVANRQVGLCLLCHSGPFPEERLQGDLAPDLRSAARLTEGQIRMRIVDPGAGQSGDHHAGVLPHRRT